MTSERKTEPPLKLDMDFGEALERFARVKPKEVAESVEQSKTKKPLGDQVPQQPAKSSTDAPLARRQPKPKGNG